MYRNQMKAASFFELFKDCLTQKLYSEMFDCLKLNKTILNAN